MILSCGQLKILYIGFGKGFKSVCSTQVFGGRKWNGLRIETGRKQLFSNRLGRNFLFKVVKNCEKLRICPADSLSWDITVIDVIEFIENCHEDKDFFKNQDWTLQNLPQCALALTEVEQRLRNMRGLKYKLSTIDKSLLGIAEYPQFQDVQIIVPRRPNVKLSFSMIITSPDQ